MSLTLTAVFFLTAAAFEFGFIDAARPDYKYINATRAWYKYHEERVSWHDASDTCRSERAVLFHPDSGDEAREVTAGLGVPAGWNYIHSGFSDLMRAGHYETVDGRALKQVYGNWSTGEPDPGSSRRYRCGLLDTRDLTLLVRPCDLPRPFICKAADPALEDAQNTIANLTAKIADLERELANRTGEAQATRIQDGNRIAECEQLTAKQNNQIAMLEAVEREAQATKIQDRDRIAECELLIANQTAALKDKSREEQIVEALERISKADENQAAGLERISKADENQAIQLKQLIETMQRLAVTQTAIMERQALAMETMANSSCNEQQ